MCGKVKREMDTKRNKKKKQEEGINIEVNRKGKRKDVMQ
jgi:hypothetical protein